VIPVINQLRGTCTWDLIVLTQDWHPADHASFASNNAGAPLFSVRTLPGMGEQVRRATGGRGAVPGMPPCTTHEPSARPTLSHLLTLRSFPCPSHAAQVMWPDHCVQGSVGAEFHPHLARASSDVVIRKGTNSRVDSYSGFGDAHGHTLERTALEDTLRAAGITDVFVCGAWAAPPAMLCHHQPECRHTPAS
jgi:nicotinamidase/pyrazinamidase